MTPTTPKFRLKNYLSYLPRSTISDLEILNKRIKGFENRLTSNHYANRSTFFQTIPGVYINKGYSDDVNDYITPIEDPILTVLGSRLVGYD